MNNTTTILPPIISATPAANTTGWKVKLPDYVDGLRGTLYILECIFGSAAIIIILLMWNCLGRISKINKNLDFVIKNAAIAMIVICVTRYFIIANQVYKNVLTYFQGYFISAVHDIAMAHIGDIQLTLMIERIYATKYVKVYELNHQKFYRRLLFFSCFVWFLSFLRILAFYKQWLRPFDVNYYCVGLTVAAAGVHSYLFYSNRSSYIKPKTHILSERYQLAENIQMHYSLIVFTTISFFHNCTILACRFIIQEIITPRQLEYEYGIVDHIWNTSTAMYFCAYPIAFIAQDQQTRRWLKKASNSISPLERLPPVRGSPLPGPMSIRSVIGRELMVDNESNTYFDQLQAAWR